MHTPAPQGLLLVALQCALGLTLVWDWRTRKIPNALNLTMMLGGLLHSFIFGGAHAALISIFGVVSGIALLYVQFSRGWMGGGDVKLMGAIGAWAGPLGAFYVLLAGSVIGGMLSMLALLRLHRSERVQIGHNLLGVALERRLSLPEPSQLSRQRGIPFGIALAVAAMGCAMNGWFQ